jgi:uncharacterized delta-60 repeat protein
MNRFLLTGLTAAALLVPANTALAAPGDLDTTFSGDGLLTADLGGPARGVDTAVQPDGKVVALAQRDIGSSSSFEVVRFNSDGTPDPRFAGDGQAEITFADPNFTSRSHPTSIALQPDGKIVVAGDTDAKATATNPHDMAVARLNADGSLDKTFNGTGQKAIDFGKTDGVNDVAVQADGKIVVAGTALIGNDEDFAVARLTAGGKLDPEWSGDGQASTHFQVDERLNAITIAPDGEVVAAGRFNADSTSRDSDTALARYTTAGQPEATFSGDGKQIINFGKGDSAVDVASQPDGKLLLAIADVNVGATATNRVDTVVARLTAAGERDVSFGTGGSTTVPVSTPNIPTGLGLTNSGRVVVGANAVFADDRSALLAAELDPDGQPAQTFSGDGVALFEVGATTRALTVEGDRALLVGDVGTDLAIAAVTVDVLSPPQEPPASPPAEQGPGQQQQPPVPPAPADAVAPVVSKLKLKATRGSEKGAFRLSEQATVKVTVQRKVKRGRRTRLVAARTLTLKGKAGANAFKVKKLRAGAYRVTLKATDGAGNPSKALRKSFTIKKGATR